MIHWIKVDRELDIVSDILPWLTEYVGKAYEHWEWNVDAAGYRFMSFIRQEDAVAFKIKFGL